MRYLLLLCTSLSIANQLCTIRSTAIFEVANRAELQVYLTNPQNGFVDKPVGSLFAPLLVNQLEVVEPDSIITRAFNIHSSKKPETYHISESIQLIGCDIEFVNIQSDDVIGKYEIQDNSVHFSYRLKQKDFVESKPQDAMTNLLKQYAIN